MKKPRIDAFITSEKAKELATPLDGMPTIRPPATHQPAAQQPHAASLKSEGVPPYPSTDVPHTPASLGKRLIVQRRPFDIYADQYDRLKQLAREDILKGGAGSMSRMVREAIDAYLEAYDRADSQR